MLTTVGRIRIFPEGKGGRGREEEAPREGEKGRNIIGKVKLK